MAKNQKPVSEVLIEICLKKARKEKTRADKFDYKISRQFAKSAKAIYNQDLPLAAVELAKLAGVALAAAELAYSGGDSC